MNVIHTDNFAEYSSCCVEPFLKWAGGKRWLFRRYRHLFPLNIDRLIDPFIGGGSSFFYLNPRSAVLSDLNSDLINLYAAVRGSSRLVTKHLSKHQKLHNKKYYYKVRAAKPENKIEKAAWLLYLNRTCWNGLFRVNLKGEFNVPIGTKSKVFSSADELDLHAFLLQRARLLQRDFEKAIDSARKGDVIFADPPYFEKNRNLRFLKYNQNVFSWEDQLRLRTALVRARRRGACCYVTNSNHKSLLKLYRGVGKIHLLERHSVLSGNNSGRRKDFEMLVEMT